MRCILRIYYWKFYNVPNTAFYGKSTEPPALIIHLYSVSSGTMPNVSHDLEPRFDREIDADIVDFGIDEVSGKGWAGVESKYGHHLVAWVPMEDRGQLKTTTYSQKHKKRVQSYVQKDGGINIGTEEWAGKRILILILDRKLEEDE
ncbi:hypothetical protein OB920_13215 [Halobacteria archaeon HArc-gm2]|nr:hypothetical protein [Halobacteria archaeon HArc-gm2]